MSPTEYDAVVQRLEQRLGNGEGDVCQCGGLINPIEMLMEMRHEFVDSPAKNAAKGFDKPTDTD